MADLKIEVRFPNGTTRQETLTGDVTKIGRLTSAHLSLEDASVSRMHAVIERSSGGWTLIDLGSGTGTHLEGKKVNKARLYNGATFAIGEVKIRVLAGGEPTLRDFQAPPLAGAGGGLSPKGSGYFSSDRAVQRSPRIFVAMGAAVAVLSMGIAVFLIQAPMEPAASGPVPTEPPTAPRGVAEGRVSIPSHTDADASGWICRSGFLNSFRGVDVGPADAVGLLRLFEDPMYGERVRVSLEEGATVLEPEVCDVLSVVLEDSPSPTRSGALMFRGRARFSCATDAGEMSGDLTFSDCDVP